MWQLLIRWCKTWVLHPIHIEFNLKKKKKKPKIEKKTYEKNYFKAQLVQNGPKIEQNELN